MIKSPHGKPKNLPQHFLTEIYHLRESDLGGITLQWLYVYIFFFFGILVFCLYIRLICFSVFPYRLVDLEIENQKKFIS